MCSICGQPGFIRCNCQSAQPFCDQCDQNSVCVDKTDAQCVVYHFATPGYTPPPTRLINLGLPNGSNAETIFEKIDSFFGAGFFRPWTTGNTATVDLSLTGLTLPVVLEANVNVSAASGNTLIINPDGLYVSGFLNTGKVKVDANTIARYLEDTMFGGTDGCVSLSINNVGGFLHFQPLLDIECFTERICSSSGDTKIELGACLIGSSLIVTDSDSIDLTLNEFGLQMQIIADAKISSASGNTLIINPDGLYTAGGGNANNGLTPNSGIIQLGGPLIQDTTIDFGSSFQLNFTNNPLLSIGSSAPLTTATVFINDSNATGSAADALAVNQERNLTDVTGFIANDSFLKIIGGPFTQGITTFNSAVGGQLWLFPTGDLTLNASTNNIIAGIYGTFIKSGTNNITGNIVAGGQFQGNATNSGNVTNMASIRLGGLNAPPTSPFGPAFTGVVTNYYGAYFEDIGSSTYAANITNKYAIFQAGTTDLNVFSTAATVSDVRKKENILTYNKGLNEIDKLRIVEYNFISDVDKTKKVGVIAQEVEEILPEAIHTKPIGNIEDFKLVENNVIFYTMLNAIKELSSQNKSLNERLLALEGRNTVFGTAN